MEKRVASYSLGSSQRDKTVDVQLNGHSFHISRQGFNGNLSALAQAIAACPPEIDVLTLGGIDFELEFLHRSFPFRDAKRLRAAAHHQPLVDGANFKRWVEPMFFRQIFQQGTILPRGKVFFPLGANRLFLAAEMARCGFSEIVFGDLIYNVGFPPYLIKGIPQYTMIGTIAGRLVANLPFAWIYPAGEGAEPATPRLKQARHFYDAEIIAGDYHSIHRFLPHNLGGKTIVTNTVTAEDVTSMRQKGVSTLVTFASGLDGRIFGANVWDGIVTAYLREHALPGDQENYLHAVQALGLAPSCTCL